MKKLEVTITFRDELEMRNGLYDLSMLSSYKSALFDISHNLYSRVKYKEVINADVVLEEVRKIIEEEGIDINRLDS
jgi:hypothetical protein